VGNYSHNPVLTAEVLEGVRPRQSGTYFDGTVGGGGHAEAILEASAPDGWLYGCDRDAEAVRAARERLSRFGARLEICQRKFSQLEGWIEPGSCDGVLLDLGVSSPQLDEAARGFSFQQDGPLDMRMDTGQSLSAAHLVNETPAEELARIFWELGGERAARRLAREIERARAARPIESTGQLAALIERVKPRRGARTHPATRVFQALRMAVNDELGELERGLAAAWTILKPGGRMAVITFHSLEDRMVKEFGRKRERDYTVVGGVDVPELRVPARAQLRWINRKAIQPSEVELARNARARSAQLRTMEKL
jgi:16S rRNA (cytosine1402-N4)-methyltransferase